ncbi:stress response translation initiation inhibitor YciH [Paraferrimonas sedimenticola]|uniref:Translation initiation factor n=1 Tax=Paraferrimonas sedimenticola TaxID=375674 RepID=A0AA37VYN8_9GAMM|nr:stress response translation initiation inhibitor YciH [Paraferrimonas sedimenticola]GLP97121.1 translation initiation factor [Paraferrimonas sedimenticola]
MSDNSNLVYSTDGGRIKADNQPSEKPSGDGVVRLKRETKGRKGKGVVIVEGLLLEGKALKDLASKLKKQCGCGGSVKGFNVEVQTDDREKLKSILEKLGYQVKIAGG